MRKITSLFFLFVLGLYSCQEEDYLHGYSSELLFASPTQQELDAVVNDWKSRDLSPKNYSVIQTAEVFPDITLKIVSFTVSGHTEYGALLIPKSNITLPVHTFIGGFGIDSPINAVKLAIDQTFFDDPFIFVFPALRGQSLRIMVNDVAYSSPASEGEHCEAFDGAADDAIALLNIVENTEQMADMNRVAVRGGSRGGTVALLIGERDKRVKLAIGVAGPTNMMELTSKNESDRTYQCQFLGDLTNGSALSEVRHKMIASSPVFFAKDLPKTQLHLAANDVIVPPSQGEELKNVINNLGQGSTFEMFIYEGRDHSNIAESNTDMTDRIKQFLKQL
jgi:dienelactone hydrolase